MTHHLDFKGHRTRNGVRGEGRRREGSGGAGEAGPGEAPPPPLYPAVVQGDAGADALLLPPSVGRPPLAGPLRAPALPHPLPPPSGPWRPTRKPSVLSESHPPLGLWGSQSGFCSRSGVARLGHALLPFTGTPPTHAHAHKLSRTHARTRAHGTQQEAEHVCSPPLPRALQGLRLDFRIVRLSTSRHPLASSSRRVPGWGPLSRQRFGLLTYFLLHGHAAGGCKRRVWGQRGEEGAQAGGGPGLTHRSSFQPTLSIISPFGR